MTQRPIYLEVKNFSQTTTVVATMYKITNPFLSDATTSCASLEASFIPINWNKAYASKSSIHMHPSQVVAPKEAVKDTKVKHSFYFVKPNGEKQLFHGMKKSIFFNYF